MDPDPRIKALRARLLAWYARRRRDLPWRAARDPYRIWVSEIMLQQTRVETAVPYYLRFLERFPTLAALAAAPQSAVLALWSGLGYYRRARNLHRAARLIHAAGGRFPADYAAIRALPGVGPYTAAAIASIAFGLPHAALDGNVLRVLARLENDPADIAASAARRRLEAVAQSLLHPRRPGDFNQALMELGAVVCLPRAPLCPACPVRSCCRARASGTAAALPVKRARPPAEAVEAVLVLVRRNGRVLLRRRPASAAQLAGFWELPRPEDLPGARLSAPLAVFAHAITRRRYRIAVVSAQLPRAPRGMRWFPVASLSAIPLGAAARKALAAVS